MTDEIVLLDIKDNIAHVTLNRPEVHNAFDENVILRLNEIWDDLADNSDVIAVVLRGKGKSFSAGGDLNWMKRAASFTQEQNKEDALLLSQMLYRLYSLPKFTIACVQGAAMGGGMGLACCCDMVVAEDSTVFALSEVKLGLIPATIGPYVIRALGERQARRFFSTGHRITGSRAHDLGLVHEVVGSAEEMEEFLSGLFKSLHANGPQAITEAKKLCLELAGKDITPELLDQTAQRIADIRAGDEAKEGIAAFFGKRKANWNE